MPESTTLNNGVWLAATQGATARALNDELYTLQQTLAAQRALATHSQASSAAQMEAARALAEAHAATAEAVLDATKNALEVRIQVAVQEREQAERSLEELAGLSRGTALRLYQGQLAAAVAERERLAAEGAAAAGPAPAAGASVEEEVRYAITQRVVERTESMDKVLAERTARLTRLCAILELPPKA